MRSYAFTAAALLLLSTATVATPVSLGEYFENMDEALLPRQAGEIQANSSISIDPAFPTDVGFLGTIQLGTPPFAAQNNRINTTKPVSGSAIEDRYVPANSTNSSFELNKYWGNTSPWFPSPLFPDVQKFRQIDPQCKIKQVHIVHRHGARYPTASTSPAGAAAFGQTIANATRNASMPGGVAFEATGPLAFLMNWTYPLGAEVLVPAGAQQEFDSGIKSYIEYGALYNVSSQAHKPVIRTTSQERMLESARYWTAGFFGLDAPNLIDLEVIIEKPGLNNTLAPYFVCNNSDNIAIAEQYLVPDWNKKYLASAVDRLQQYIPSGLNLTIDMLAGMQTICPYETAALGYSAFCELFTEDEWRGFEYALDLGFQGDYGYMSPTGRAQGIGWAQEFLARLTNTTIPAANVTTQNTTFLTPTYFPMDQPIYADFTHDSVILSILTALNYSQVAGDYLNATEPDDDRTFVLSHITPFAARVHWEIAECSGTNETIIRTILNDALIPMNEAQGCTPRQDGSCLLSEFVAFQTANAYDDANYNFACSAKNGTDFTITGPSVRNGTIYGHL